MLLARRVDASRGMPLYMQLIHALIHEIQRGRLTPGTFLPSSRELATALGVNRKTVVLAYEDLIAQGWLEALGTRGTRVAASLPDLGLDRRRGAGDAPFPARIGTAEYPFHDAGIPLPSQAWELKLDEGSPDGRLLSPDTLVRAYRGAIQRAARDNRLLYGDPRGSATLRAAIAAMLRAQRGVMATADEICVTRGSQMAVFLAARILLRPGDTVLAEALAYQPAVDAFRACGANVIAVGLDRHGVDVEEVERLCRVHRIRAIFLTPHHQFPTTVALQPDRRLRLLELARQFAFAVIEDDYDHEFHFQSQPLLPLASYAPERTIYVGSLSKLLLPALRIGYVAAPAPVIDALAQQVLLVDTMGNTLTQDAAAELIDSGEVRRHIRRASQVYARRRAAFAETLRQELGDVADFDLPDGGLAFWLRFRDPRVLDRIERRAPALGLWLASSRSYATLPDAPRGLRLGFASLDQAEAREAIRRLRQAATEGDSKMRTPSELDPLPT